MATRVRRGRDDHGRQQGGARCARRAVLEGVAAWRQLGGTTGLGKARSLLVVLGAAAAAAGRGAKESTTSSRICAPRRRRRARERAVVEFDAWVHAWEWRTARSLTLAQQRCARTSCASLPACRARLGLQPRAGVSVMDREGDHGVGRRPRLRRLAERPLPHPRGTCAAAAARRRARWCQDEAPDSRSGRKAHSVHADGTRRADRHLDAARDRTAKAESNEAAAARAPEERRQQRQLDRGAAGRAPAQREHPRLASSSGVRLASLPPSRGRVDARRLPEGWICACHVTPSGRFSLRAPAASARVAQAGVDPACLEDGHVDRRRFGGRVGPGRRRRCRARRSVRH